MSGDADRTARELAGILAAANGGSAWVRSDEDGGIKAAICPDGERVIRVHTGPGRSAITEAFFGVYPERKAE